MLEILAVSALTVPISVAPQPFGSSIVHPRSGVLSSQTQRNPSESCDSLSQRAQKWLFVILLSCPLWQLAESVCGQSSPGGLTLPMGGSLNDQVNNTEIWLESFDRSYTNRRPEHAAFRRGACPECTSGRELSSLPSREPSAERDLRGGRFDHWEMNCRTHPSGGTAL